MPNLDNVTEATSDKQSDTGGVVASTAYIGDIAVDVVKDASPAKKWDISRHTIDRRSDMADHRVKLPDDLIVVILITDDEAGTDPDEGPRVTEAPRTWQDKAKEIDEFVELDQVVEVVMPWKVYPELMVVGFAPRPDKDIENGQEFTISFSGVKLSGVQISDIDESMVPLKRKNKQDPPPSTDDEADTRTGAESVNSGTKSPEPVPDSWLQSVTDGVSGLLGG